MSKLSTIILFGKIVKIIYEYEIGYKDKYKVEFKWQRWKHLLNIKKTKSLNHAIKKKKKKKNLKWQYNHKEFFLFDPYPQKTKK
jgi:hypothetical protein